MKITAWNLEGVALDYAITKIVSPGSLDDGVKGWLEQRCELSYGHYHHRYCTSDLKAGPILRKYRISRKLGHSGVWIACYHYDLHDEGQFMASGKTDIEAGLRSVVLMNLGREVDIPEELL